MNKFKINNNNLFVTDINYKINSWCNINISNMKNGTYYFLQDNNILYIIKYGYKNKINTISWEESVYDYNISNGTISISNFSTDNKKIMYNNKILTENIGKTYCVYLSSENNEIIGVKINID